MCTRYGIVAFSGDSKLQYYMHGDSLLWVGLTHYMIISGKDLVGNTSNGMVAGGGGGWVSEALRLAYKILQLFFQTCDNDAKGCVMSPLISIQSL